MLKFLLPMINRAKNSLKGWMLVAVISFAIFLMAGLSVYRDYGIGWDEPSQHYIGKTNFNYAVYGNPALLTIGDRYYGPFYEMILYGLTRNQPTENQEYDARHLVQFLTFSLGTLIFFFLIRKLWKKDWLAWIGWLALVLSPRIFADAFYNSKDIPFMIAFIGAVYTLIRFLDHSSWKNLILHALCSAILIATRIPGVLIVVMTGGFILFDLAFNSKASFRNGYALLARFVVYGLVCAGLVILFWPILWHDPVHEFLAAFQQMSRYPDSTIDALYKGHIISMYPPPPSYIPTWIAISTPILYLVGFIAGLIAALVRFVRKPLLTYTVEKRNLWVLLTWFFLPIAIVIGMRSTLYNAWRQMFFVYPALILIALQGLLEITRLIDRLPRPKVFQWVLAGVILVGLIEPVSFMIRNHPYQYVYFNRLAGASLAQAKNLYEMDYWGVSSKAALEYILKTDPSKKIVVACDEPSASYNTLLLTRDENNRIVFTDNTDLADYFIGKYRNHPEDYPYSNEVFSVSVDGAKIVTVFKMH